MWVQALKDKEHNGEIIFYKLTDDLYIYKLVVCIFISWTSAGSSKKQESSRKTSISALLTMPKPLTVWITINGGKFWKKWECQTTWPASWETYMQVRKQQLDWTWNNRLVPNMKRSTSRLYVVILLIQLICRVYHEKRWAGWSTSWNQDCWENINNLRFADDTTLMAESEEELKSLLKKVRVKKLA